ncbi:30S ribosomal protein S1 [Thalictrum thalictroides]|uniref:30S ribosomal protein S1 n=1 Tax=Thalictrum thalictroides TaxID=46969 RepID=A0A7J6VU39_THATH|nr:30S ribosomal protein S1 [Thalictrum thalictroides]
MLSASAAPVVGSVQNLSFLSQIFGSSSIDVSSSSSLTTPTTLTFSSTNTLSISYRKSLLLLHQRPYFSNSKLSVSISSNLETEGLVEQSAEEDSAPPQTTTDSARQTRRSADWKAARAYKDSGAIYEGKIEGSNGGGLLVRFYSLLGFLPYPLLSPSHSCKEPHKSIQGIGKDLIGSIIAVKVVQASEETRKLIFSEREAIWSKFSGRIEVGDVFSGRVGTLEDYGAFVHLRFPDGYYHITGMVHISEVSWDLVQDVRDVLNEGDEVKVKVIQLDRGKARVTLSIKQLEDDPLLETLDKVIPEKGQFNTNTSDTLNNTGIEPLPGLDSICQELLQEKGITGVRISRQGFEKRVVSQDLQLWLSNEPAVGNQFTLLARAGRQVQEIQLTTTLDQEGVKKALQRVLERVP